MDRLPKRKLQDKFLRAMEAEDKTVNAVLDDLKITHKEFGEWLEEVPFQRKIQRLKKALSRKRSLELEHGATIAARRITLFAAGSEKSFPDRERRACLDTLRLQNVGPGRKIYPKYARRKNRSREVIAHPVVMEAEATIRRMEKRK